MRIPRAFFVVAIGLLAAHPVAAATAEQPMTPVLRSDWNGFVRLDFTLASRACVLVLPAKAAVGRPWIWRMETFGEDPQVDVALLAKGWHVAYMDAKNLYGAQKAMSLYGEFYAHLIAQAELAKRVVLEGFGAGGFGAFNFAAAHPTRVAAIYLDGAALDFRSWPGRDRTSKEWRDCLNAYGATEDSIFQSKRNPIDRISFVAAARVPIIAVAGDTDRMVPLAENTAVLEKRYREAGGPIQVIIKPGADHQPYSLKDPAPIVDFLIANAKF